MGCAAMLLTLSYDKARPSILISAYCGVLSAAFPDEAERLFRMLCVALDPEHAVGGEVLGRFARDAADEVEPVFARIERFRPLVAAHALFERAASRDVGRVRGDGVESFAAERFEKVSDQDFGAGSIEPILFDIFPDS